MALRASRQYMWIMHLVSPITARHWGPAALWFYARRSQRTARPVIERKGEPDPEKLPGHRGQGRQPLRREARPG
ncbi:hypothetical protein [Streptomyces sp. NPDC048419]|uniref:hypothetical protein n=1 Tax=Streptomyces sp. NPDC048419 TaxID=3365547 RepID=UPI00371CA632